MHTIIKASTLFVGLLLIPPVAVAQDAFHPLRVRLVLHGNIDLSDNVHAICLIVPSGNLVNGVRPIVFVGLVGEPWDWLRMEADVGWSSGIGEPILAIGLSPKYEDFWAGGTATFQTTSLDGSWFLQIEYRFLEWLHAGIEGEGWGNFADVSSWSNGGGVNVLFQPLRQTRLDFALQIRELQGVVRPEVFIRAHLFL